MCSTCTTVFDVAATNAVLALAAASNAWERVADRRRGRSRLERKLLTWEADAAFVRSLGLDPLQTLGAPPTVPALGAPDPAPSGSGTSIPGGPPEIVVPERAAAVVAATDPR